MCKTMGEHSGRCRGLNHHLIKIRIVLSVKLSESPNTTIMPNELLEVLNLWGSHKTVQGCESSSPYVGQHLPNSMLNRFLTTDKADTKISTHTVYLFVIITFSRKRSQDWKSSATRRCAYEVAPASTF